MYYCLWGDTPVTPFKDGFVHPRRMRDIRNGADASQRHFPDTILSSIIDTDSPLMKFTCRCLFPFGDMGGSEISYLTRGHINKAFN